ncbi:MAG: DUF2284 domain-containing protein [Oscillospiraceae bacterium]|nr:DUF2284 domain-containing protein [Oscillospiraceae bacterium]
MTDTQLLEIAQEADFTAAIIPTSEIVVDAKFRPFCEENLCGKFNANYSCPPDCGTVEETRQRLMAQDKALVLQSIWEIGSYENKAGILESKKTHNAMILRLTEKLRQAGLKGFCLGYGGCPLCDPCKRVMNEPCAFPEKRISCMSAYCIDVAKLAKEGGLKFAWEQDKLYLFGMFAYKEKAE